MSWIAVAIGGSALLGYMGSQNAASAQTGAANQANATQWQMYNQTRQDQMPWMQRGNAAGNQLAYLMGLGGYAPQGWSPGGGYGSMGGYMSGPRTTGYADRPTGNGIEGWTPRPQGLGTMTDTFSASPATAGLRQRPDGISPNDWAAYGPIQDPVTGQWSDGQPGGTPGASSAPDLTGINPAMGGYGSLATPFSQTNWQLDPGYQFRLSEGQKALERSASAKGMSLSGAQAKALTNYNQGMASQEYGNAYNRYNNDQSTMYNRLAGLAGTGQTATNMMGQLGANTANGVANTQASLGNALGANYINTANGMSGAINSGLNMWNNNNNWNNWLKTQGG